MWALVTWLVTYVILPIAIGTGLALLARRKPEGVKPAGKEAFQSPTAEEGRPIPVVFGKRRVVSPNALSPLLDYAAVPYEEDGVTVACLYYIGLLLGLCEGNIDGIKQFWVAETCLWPTVNDPDVEASDSETQMWVEAPFVWGGWRREGGFFSQISICYGNDSQTLNSYLESKLGSNHPAYRGITTLVLEYGIFNGLLSTYVGTWPGLKPISALCKRTDKLTDGSAMWYIAKANIGDDDLNAIHILYELLTSPIIGLGKSTSLIGDSFSDAADTCYTEGSGLSNVWDWAADDIDSMIKQIEEIVDGKLYIDYETGKFEFGLVRDDYDAGSLETFDESDFWVENKSSSSPGQIPDKVIVRWHDRKTLKDRPAWDDDIALLARQDGRLNIKEFDYSAFVCDGDLANQIAARAQMFYSAQPKRYTLHALRTMAHLHETSVFKISYPELNITSMIVRCVTIDRGNVKNGGCVLEVIEDVFGQSYTVYGSPPDPGIHQPIIKIVVYNLESFVLSDSIQAQMVTLKAQASDNIGLGDQVTSQLNLFKEISEESMMINDSISAKLNLLKEISADSITLSDSISAEIV